MLKRWEEYVKELYDDTRGEKPEMVGELEKPPILLEEVEEAIKGIRRENLWERIKYHLK